MGCGCFKAENTTKHVQKNPRYTPTPRPTPQPEPKPVKTEPKQSSEVTPPTISKEQQSASTIIEEKRVVPPVNLDSTLYKI